MRINTRLKLAWFLACGYALLVAAVIICDSKSPDDLICGAAVLLLTFPWSGAVILLGFMLIHISSHGMEYGFILGALINCALIFLLVVWLRKNGRELCAALGFGETMAPDGEQSPSPRTSSGDRPAGG